LSAIQDRSGFDREFYAGYIAAEAAPVEIIREIIKLFVFGDEIFGVRSVQA